jgi:hypothetical protein
VERERRSRNSDRWRMFSGSQGAREVGLGTGM